MFIMKKDTSQITSGQLLEVVNPYNLEPIGSVPMVDWNTIDEYLTIAQATFKDRSKWLPRFKRIEILNKASEIMKLQFEALAFQIANEGGKPLIDARVEVTRAIDSIGLCIKELSHLTGTEIPMDLTEAGAGHIAFSAVEPIGPVVAISAFNHPLNLIVHQIAPAFAVGCPFLIKPAKATPLSCSAFINILYEAGMPEEWGRFVACSTQDAEKMVTDSRVAFFSFIGSAKVGWELRSKLAPGTRCALEHGGVAPVIVDETADIDSMIDPLLKGGFYHSGQVCVSVQKVFAPVAMAEKIAKSLAAKAEKLIVGNATNENTQCGPLISPSEVDRVHSWVENAKKDGAKVFCGGKKITDTCYAPTVLFNPSNNTEVSTKEIFGPVVCVYAYENIKDALIQANSLPFAFQAAVFTQNLNRAIECVKTLDATAVMVNEHTAFRVDWMPFAGRRQSGYGTGGIGNTMHDMTQTKMAIIKHTA